MNNDFSYLGVQDPSTATGRLNELVYLIERVVNRLSTATLCQIVRAPYDAAGNQITPGSPVPIGFVDVLPLVNQLDGFGAPTPHATVHRLSYHRYQSAAGAVISDPAVGDIGKMVVAERDTSAVRATNAQSNPGSLRTYNKADGTYFGCTQGNAPTQYLSFAEGGLSLVDKNGNSIVTSSSGIVVTDVNSNVITTSSAGVEIRVKSGGLVKIDAGGTTQPVKLADGSDSIVLMAQ